MPNDLPRFYWDACVPLSYINGITERLPHIDAFMSKSGEEFQLITSVLSITEVAFATYEKDNQALDQDIEAKIGKLWQVGSPVKIAEFYGLIALKAQQLMRAAIAKGWSLKPADAIHLATADQLEVKAFHTYDRKLDKFSVLTDTKFPIVPPISAAPYLPLVNAPVEAEPPKTTLLEAGQGAEKEQTATGKPDEPKITATQAGEDPIAPKAELPAAETAGGGGSKSLVDATGVEPASSDSQGTAPGKKDSPPLSR